MLVDTFFPAMILEQDMTMANDKEQLQGGTLLVKRSNGFLKVYLVKICRG